MKVTGVETFPIAVPPEQPGGPYWMFLRLDTDEGVSGYGELMFMPLGFRWPVVSTMVEDLVDQAVLGHDPYNAEQLYDSIYGRAGYSHTPEKAKLAIVSALDMACWDIVGKHLGQPVHRLLGGRVRDTIRTYTYMYAGTDDTDLDRSLRDLWLDPEHAAQRARHYVDLGFTAIKLDPFALSISDDQALGQTVPIQFTMSALSTAEAVVGAVRDEIGDAADILIGTHGQMTPASAIRFAKRVERYDPLWFEEPVPPENMVALAEVARATSIPITAGERLRLEVRVRAPSPAQRRGDLQLRRRFGRWHHGVAEDRHDGRVALRPDIAARLRRSHDLGGVGPAFALLPELSDHGGSRALRRPVRRAHRPTVHLARGLHHPFRSARSRVRPA